MSLDIRVEKLGLSAKIITKIAICILFYTLGFISSNIYIEKRNEKIKNNPNFINYYNQTKNIMEMAYIMQKSASVICVDSAPLHVAVCVKAKIYAIFGPTNEIKLVPKENNIEIIKNNIECRPCLCHKNTCNCKESNCLNINHNLILDKIN